MATSGSVNYADLRNTLLTDALMMIEAIGTGMTASSEDLDLANRVLNRMIKAWQADGLHLWKTKTATIFLEKGKRKYTLGGSNADHATETPIFTQVSTAALSGATTLIVDSTSGMTAADNIGIGLDDDTIQWTTISSVDSSTQVTLAAALTDDVAVDNVVYVYTTNINKPLNISYAIRRDTSNHDVEINELAFQEYQQLPTKLEQGTPHQWCYMPRRLDGDFYLWHTPENSDYRIEIMYTSPLEDMDGANDEFDFPAEWQRAIVCNLALELTTYFNKPEKVSLIAPLAEMTYDKVLSWDNEKVSLYLQPNDYGEGNGI